MSAQEQSEWPREIEVGGGPNIIAHSQGEMDGFFEAARQNAANLRARAAAESVALGRLPVVALYNTAIERPDAPLAYCGPFDSLEAAQAFASDWDSRTTCPTVEVRAGFFPTPDDFAAFVAAHYDVTVA